MPLFLIVICDKVWSRFLPKVGEKRGGSMRPLFHRSKTGERRLMEFFLSQLLRYKQESVSER